MTFKPMLAVPVCLPKLRYPVIVQPKLDGIRCVITEDGAVSRMLKPIANHHIRDILSHVKFRGLDGEIMTYTDGVEDSFHVIQSKVMAPNGTPDFRFVVFDNFNNPNHPYEARLPLESYDYFIKIIDYRIVNDEANLLAYEAEMLEQRYEGIMIRQPNAVYKFGRSGLRDQSLLKMKRFLDAEATVTGMVEQLHNGNEQIVNALGHAKRSTHKANKTPMGVMGTLVCRAFGVEFEIGTGFTDIQRKAFWNHKDELIGQTVTFKYQELSPYGVPRFPVFLGFRYDLNTHHRKTDHV